jgi:hypothetical protein
MLNILLGFNIRKLETYYDNARRFKFIVADYQGRLVIKTKVIL